MRRLLFIDHFRPLLQIHARRHRRAVRTQIYRRRAPEFLATLAKLFNIRIVKNPDWASIDMVTVAKRNLGAHVPPPFYRGFPFTVQELALEEIILDRLLHYVRTYGLGDFSSPGYSVFEDEAALSAYATHPDHVLVANTYVRPYTETRLCLDFEA
jgi:hypothetical protein